jgi:quercetin dioxygenase-like cupin family protein
MTIANAESTANSLLAQVDAYRKPSTHLATTTPRRPPERPHDHPQRKELAMKITPSSNDTMKGPADWFTGDVYIDMIPGGSEPSRLSAANVHFTPGARTAWHTHPLGQTIFVIEGVGLCQREGGPIETIRPGDSVYFEPGENHWHGAAPKRFMLHTAMQETDDTGSPVTWGEHVTNEQYSATPTA